MIRFLDYTYQIRVYDCLSLNSVFILFFESIYPEDSQKRLAKFSLLAGLLFSFAAIFTDTTISTGFVTYFQVLLLCLILYIFYVLIIINIRKREGAVWIALGLIIFGNSSE